LSDAFVTKAGTARVSAIVPGGGRGELGGDQHVGAVVLDRLEHADRPAELLAHLRVPAGGLDALERPAGGLGRDQGTGDRGRAGPGAVQHLPDRDTVEPDARRAPGRVQVRRHLDGDTRGAPRYEHQVVPGGEHEQRSQAGAEHDARVALGHSVGQRDRPAQPDRGRHGAAREVRQPLPTLRR
jgi:hypothetical protein